MSKTLFLFSNPNLGFHTGGGRANGKSNIKKKENWKNKIFKVNNLFYLFIFHYIKINNLKVYEYFIDCNYIFILFYCEILYIYIGHLVKINIKNYFS